MKYAVAGIRHQLWKATGVVLHPFIFSGLISSAYLQEVEQLRGAVPEAVLSRN